MINPKVMRVLMCRPQFFTVNEKDPENLFMDPLNLPDRKLSLFQHEKLAQTYRGLGIDIRFIQPVNGLSDMTFAANSAFICDRKAILANFKPKRRQGETLIYEKFYKALGYETIVPPQDIFFEGAGDALLYRERILLGCGFRTSKKAGAWLEKITGREVILLELVKPLVGDKIFYHADTAILLFEEEKTFILYPGAFTKESLDRLDALGRIYPVSYEDAASLALNGLVVKRSEMSLAAQDTLDEYFHGVAVLSSTASSRVQKTIKHIGYRPILVGLTEFLKAGGGPFCLTKAL
jgi:N-dimethylarginine dimethylaminohydrolase